MKKWWIVGLAIPAVAGANELSCDVSTFSAGGLEISGAEWKAPEGEALVDYCQVTGTLNAYTGMDGREYGIDFELRLPKKWHGQFAYQFNGGNDGAVKPALGSLSSLVPEEFALNRGMAVVSSDGGHSAGDFKDMGLAGGSGFGFDAKARARYGYQAVEELYPVAESLIEQFYGVPSKFQYGIGSSNGGRMAMVAASRFPTFFDGLIVGYPGFNLPKAAVQHAWDIQHLLSVNGALKTSLSSADLNLVANHVIEQCDDLDGLKDGLVFNSRQCQNVVDIQSLVCDAVEGCLTQEKADVLVALHEGPTNSAGKALYSDWSFDTGIASKNWRFWKIESPIPGWGFNPIIGAMGSSSLAMIFTTPPTVIEGKPDVLISYLNDFDFDTDAPKIYQKSEAFPESSMEFMTPPDAANPTLAAFKQAGGKMLIFHGNSDPVFSVNDTQSWYEKLDSNQGGRADEFVRFYPVPGMSHGKGGPSLDKFDPLSPVVAWVEQGKVPSHLISRAHEDNKEVSPALKGASRPLCPFPSIAVYTKGNTASADSFSCR